MSTRSLCQLGIVACVCSLTFVMGCGGSSGSADNPTVYAADGEASYHVEGCPNLGADAKSLTKREAEGKGLKPCIRCLKSSLAALSASAQTYGNKAQEAIDAEMASSDAVKYEFYWPGPSASAKTKTQDTKRDAGASNAAKAEEIRRIIAKSGSFPKIKSLTAKSDKDATESPEKTSEKDLKKGLDAKKKTDTETTDAKSTDAKSTDTESADAKSADTKSASASDSSKQDTSSETKKKTYLVQKAPPARVYVAIGVSKCFHKDAECRAMRKSKEIKQVSSMEALQEGLTACNLCFPSKSTTDKKTDEKKTDDEKNKDDKMGVKDRRTGAWIKPPASNVRVKKR